MERIGIFKRIPQMNGSARSFRILADGSEIGRLEAGVFEKKIAIPPGTRSLQVKMRPYHLSSKLDVKPNKSSEKVYHVGFITTNDFQTLLPTSLKIIEEENFGSSTVSNSKPWPRLSVNRLWVVNILGVLAGTLLLKAAYSSSDSELSFLFLMLGVGALGGCYSAYRFNKPNSTSSFPYQKPFWDAGSLIFLGLCVGRSGLTYQLISVVILLVACGWFNVASRTRTY